MQPTDNSCVILQQQEFQAFFFSSSGRIPPSPESFIVLCTKLGTERSFSQVDYLVMCTSLGSPVLTLLGHTNTVAVELALLTEKTYISKITFLPGFGINDWGKSSWFPRFFNRNQLDARLKHSLGSMLFLPRWGKREPRTLSLTRAFLFSLFPEEGHFTGIGRGHVWHHSVTA